MDCTRWNQRLAPHPATDDPDTLAVAASGDGTTIVGVRDHRLFDRTTQQGFRWNPHDGIVQLGILGSFENQTYSSATDVSLDGSTIAGTSSSMRGPFEAFIWTSGTGMRGLGDLPGGAFNSSATAISADGSVIVRQGVSNNGPEAFLWTTSGGMMPLGVLGSVGSAHFTSAAEDVSADGRVVIGFSSSLKLGGSVEAFRWTEPDGMQGLGFLNPDDYGSAAIGTSADGSVVFGVSMSDSGHRPFVWDVTHGMRDFQQVLIQDYGLEQSLAGWRLSDVYDISTDGLSIVGTGFNPTDHMEAWLVRLDHPIGSPEPASLFIFLSIVLLLLLKRRRCVSRCNCNF
jgi:probable HAF family extracellular repeat protein